MRHGAEQQLGHRAEPARPHDHLVAVQLAGPRGDLLRGLSNDHVPRVGHADAVEQPARGRQRLGRLLLVEVLEHAAADEHRDVAMHRRLHVEQVDFERLAILDELDDVPDGAERIRRAVDWHQCLEHGDLRLIEYEVMEPPAPVATTSARNPTDLLSLAKVWQRRGRRRPHDRGRSPGLTIVR